jgi:hypothetical protein
MDGSPAPKRCGGVNGNVTGGPTPGALIAADPATVERSGFAIGHAAPLPTKLHGAGVAGSEGTPEKPLAWHREQPGWTPLLLRIVRLREPANAGKARRTRSGSASMRLRKRTTAARDAESQETCRPSGHSPGGVFPTASTEVVVAHTLSSARAGHASAFYRRFGSAGLLARGMVG